MKVKLNKGPLHGKIYVVPEGDRSVILHTVSQGGMLYSLNDGPLTQTNKIRTVEYRMKIMNHPEWGIFPAVDPDGRVFFEYTP